MSDLMPLKKKSIAALRGQICHPASNPISQHVPWDMFQREITEIADIGLFALTFRRTQDEQHHGCTDNQESAERKSCAL